MLQRYGKYLKYPNNLWIIILNGLKKVHIMYMRDNLSSILS